MKKKGWLIGLLSVSLLFGACSQKEEHTTKESEADTTTQVSSKLTVSTPAPISTLDTTQTTDKNTFTMVQHLFEGLTRFNEKTEPVPGLAETIDVSDDGLTYTFKIRPGATWSNGDPVTAHDFDYAWKKLVNPATQGPNAYLLDNVKNSRQIREGQGSIDDIGLSVPDDRTFVVELSYAQPSFLSVTSVGWLAPQQEAFVTEKGDSYGATSDDLLYTGPFILTDWDGTTETWTLKKNEVYYDKEAVKLDEVAVQTLKEEATGINLFESGELDLVKISGQYVPQYSQLDGFHQSQDVSNNFLDFNKKNGSPLSNVDLRRAIALGIDKKSLTSNVLADGSQPLNGLVPQHLYSNPETNEDYRSYGGEYNTFDIEKAKASWNKAQEALGEKVTLRLLASDNENGKKVSEYLQSQLEEALPGLSIQVALQPSNNVNQSRRDKDYELSLSGWIAGSSELDSYFNLYVDDSAYNYGAFENKEYTDLVVGAKTTAANQVTKQFDHYKQAEKILLEDNVAQVPIYQSASNYLVNPGLKGVEFPLYGGYFFLRNAEKTD